MQQFNNFAKHKIINNKIFFQQFKFQNNFENVKKNVDKNDNDNFKKKFYLIIAINH